MQKYFLLLIFILSSPTFAETWKINDDHSEVSFKIPYLKITEVNGRFTQFHGEVEIKNEVVQSIVIKIETKSIFTGNNIRDGHLKSAEFLKVNQYPLITFRSSHIKQQTDGRYFVTGPLTIKDQTRQHQFQFELSKIVEDTWAFKNRFAKFQGKIKRHDFGINWDKSLKDNQYLIGEEIEISGQFQIQPLNNPTPTHKFMIPDTQFTRAKDRLNRGEEVQMEAAKPVIHESSLKNRPSETPTTPEVEGGNGSLPTLANLEFNRNLTWWIAFLVLGMFGFVAAIGGSYWIKFKMSLSSNHQYSEERSLGIISDLLAIGLITIYAIAFWYVGWNV